MHTLYVKLMILLLCITFSVILMQAGSLFLLDYNPGSLRAIVAVNQQEMFWKHQLDLAQGKQPADFESVMQSLEVHHLGNILPELVWLQKQKDAKLSDAFKKLHLAQITFDQSRILNARFDQQRSATMAVIVAYDELGDALARDLEMKQSVISLLQLLGLFLVICSLGAIALGARRILVDRFDALTNFIPSEFIKPDTRLDDDEFARLERALYEMSASLEGYKAETAWFNQTSSERLRRMIRLQDFLFKFVHSVNDTMLSDTALRKGLFSLEKALNVNNAALILTEDDANLSTERILFSQHKPLMLTDSVIEDLRANSFVRFYAKNVEGLKSQVLAVGFTSPSGALGVLLLEANEDHLFDETETQLLEVTAQLLTMIMGFQGREQEGRRVALLEERSALARELHDSLAQSLSYMKIQISRLQSSAAVTMTADARDDIINQLREGLDNAYRELRELLATFRVHMDVRGLNFAIQSAIDEFTQRGNLSINLDNRLVNCRLTVNEEFHILHVIREALSNIVRHSGAASTMVSLEYQSTGTILVTIDDDGIGYTPKHDSQAKDGETEDTPGHYGQKIMKERAYSLGGDITVLRRRKGGTRVRLVFTPKLPQ